MSGFSSLGIGASALQAAQRGLDLAGQNISNVNTPGYSRQRLQQVSLATAPVPSMYTRSLNTGDGVLALGTDRIRDSFLEARAQQVRGSAAAASSVATAMGGVEAAFGEPGDTGLQAQLASFWNAWGDLASDPRGGPARTQVLEQGSQLAASFAQVSGRLSAQWGTTRAGLDTTVADVNRTAQNVADLNAAIRTAKVNGSPTAGLEDQRDQLVTSLGDAIGAVGKEMDDGTVTVTVGGSVLVAGARTTALTTSGPPTGPGAGSAQVVWADSGNPATVTGGTAGGMLTALNVSIAGAASRLDAVAAQLASTVNAQQAAGYDANGNPGAPFFSGTTAAGLSLALTGTAGVAASAAPPPAADGANADAMAAHLEDKTGVDATYRELVVGLGIQAQGANRAADVQGALLQQADSARLGVSSVGLDEEMVSLMSYQHAYQAAARYVSVVDSTLDVLMQMAR